MSGLTPSSNDLPHPSPEMLIVAAQHEEARPTRSRLEPCGQVIVILREKRWSFAAITAWLAQNGVHVAASTVQRFYRSRQREGLNGSAVPAAGIHQPSSFFDSTHEKPQVRPGGSTPQPASKPKFNTNF